jgi:hypothetical protein
VAVYVYKSEDGEVVEREFPMGEAIAGFIRGRKYFTRVFTAPTVRIVGADSGGGAGQSPLGNQHNEYRDKFARDVDDGKVPYDKEDLVY